MEGIIVLAYFNHLIDQGLDTSEAILCACHTRLRPVLMTSFAACVGLLPAAVSTGIGAQVQKPLALVVVGGILLAPVSSSLSYRWRSRCSRGGSERSRPARQSRAPPSDVSAMAKHVSNHARRLAFVLVPVTVLGCASARIFTGLLLPRSKATRRSRCRSRRPPPMLLAGRRRGS
jgi:AcrB/AcrD/AcrF family protein